MNSNRTTVQRAAPFAIPATVTMVWASYVMASGQWARVLNNWEASVTMVFGSFVAGSTPQGGGAVAFPVLTKILQVPAEVARTFAISIQTIGMGSAALIILVVGRKLDKRATLESALAGVLGFFVGLFAFGLPDTTFWSFRIDPAYVKVTFTIIVAAMAYIVLLGLGGGDYGTDQLPHRNRRITAGIVLSGFVGGVISALTGTGVGVVMFLFLVVLAGLHPRVGVPSAVVAMAAVSAVGLATLGVFHGQLDITLVGDQVVAVGGSAIAPLPAAQFDIFGLWLAAVPVVTWGAPLGSFVAHALKEKQLIAFVVSMASLEVISTALFLRDLRTNRFLQLFAVGGLAIALATVWYLHRHRYRLLGFRPQPNPDRPVPQSDSSIR